MNQNISENIPNSAQFRKITLIDTLTLCSVVKRSESRGGEFSFRNSGRRRWEEEGGGGRRREDGGESKCINQKYFLYCQTLGDNVFPYSFPYTNIAHGVRLV